MPGHVYLVGAGPGAADLLTLRAAKLLREADVVLHDALVDVEVLALAQRARLINVGKRSGKHSHAQRFINKRLIAAAQTHAVVVRLKGGDPMLFGRAQEELDALHRAGIATEVVPGVTAALAAAAQIQQSLTERGVARSVTFATPATGLDESASGWLTAVTHADTIVLYMAARNAAQHAQQLIQAGKCPSTPAVYVESASHPGSRQCFLTLGGIAAGELDEAHGDGPGLLMIGAVYRRRLQRPTLSQPASPSSLHPFISPSDTHDNHRTNRQVHG